MTLFTALTSLITGKAVDPKIAMTGEIMLSGAVLPVGRIKREGFGSTPSRYKKVILPKENESDLDDVPEEVRSELNFATVETIEEVLNEALDINIFRSVLSYAGNNFVPIQNI
jgi:ATP-dependent Lon protease